MDEDIKKYSYNEVLNTLRGMRTDEEIDYLLSYRMDIYELYQYLIGSKNVCECSMEMQCAVYDNLREYYDLYVDTYFIEKMRPYRVDKDFRYLNFPHDFDFDQWLDSCRVE